MAKAKAKEAPVEETGEDIVIGSTVRFQGYDDSVPEEERVLEAGKDYKVVQLPTEVEDEESGEMVLTGYGVEVENPNFNPKKKAHADNNPKFLSAEVMPEEIELVDGEVEEEDEEEEEEVEAPAPKKAAAKTPAKTAAKKAAATEEAPAPKKAAAKTAATKTAAKAAGKPATKAAAKTAKAPAVQESADLENDLPELEGEDEDIVALMEEHKGKLVDLARSLETQTSEVEFQLAATLYHIKRTREYEKLDKRYKENGGFELFLMEQYSMSYRKGMHLIAIYVGFTTAGVGAERYASIGYTKASKIAKPMLGAETDIDDLLKLAEENTVEGLSDALKDTVEVGGTKTPGVKVERLTLRYRFLKEEAGIVEDILANAKSMLNTADENQALLHILQDWAASNSGAPVEEEEVEEEVEQAPAPKKAAAKKAPGKPAAKKARATA